MTARDQGDDEGAAVVPVHRSRAVRVLLRITGALALAVGVIGVVVPVLPTTPFVLLSAFCFARASPSLHGWLLRTRLFGPLIREWHRHRAIPWRTKLVAIAMMTATLSVSIVFFVRPLAAQLGLAALGIVLVAVLYRIPSRDAPRG